MEEHLNESDIWAEKTASAKASRLKSSWLFNKTRRRLVCPEPTERESGRKR